MKRQVSRRPSEAGSKKRKLISLLLVAVAYGVVAALTSLTASLPGGVAPIFPSAGIALAAVLVMGRRALPGIWLGSFAANTIIYWDSAGGLLRLGPGGAVVTASIAAGAALGAWTGAWLGRHIAGKDEWFATTRSVLALCTAASVAGAAVSSIAGVLTLGAARIIPLHTLTYSWLTWLQGDYFGCLVAAPLVLGWRQRRRGMPGWKRLGEATGLTCVLLLLAYVVFFRGKQLEYGILPLLFWAAFRFGLHGTSATAALMSILATIGTLAGSGPFSRATINDSLLSLHIFLGVTLIAGLLLAALLSERMRASGELSKAEEQARLSDERLRQAARTAAIGVFDHDHRTGSVYWSPELRAFYGLEATEEITSSTFFERIHPEDRERTESCFRQAQDPGGVGILEVEHRVVRCDLVERWMVTRAQTFFEGEDTARHPVRTLGASFDVTSRKRAEQQRERLETQLRRSQRMESLGTLAGGIAHDFNNVLTAILGNAELSLLDAAEGSKEAGLLKEILAASERARQLVSRILTFSRRAESRPVICDLSLIVNEALDLLRAASPTPIEIRRHLAEVSAVIDPTQFHQVVMNLATNAAQAMEQRGGVLDVRLEVVSVEDDDKVHQRLEPGNYASLTVSDTGIGIAPEALERMFEPYFTTKEVGKGTGLGLSVVHGIVTAAGGAIRVESEPERGTTFRVYLPVAASHNQVAVVGQPAIPRGTESVLVVDDEAMILALTAKSLGALGYKVTALSRAEEALASFRAAPDRFDVVVTDLTMPGMSGETLAEHLLATRPALPIIVCTGFGEESVAQRLIARGVRTVLAKPMSRASLANAIREGCMARRSA